MFRALSAAKRWRRHSHARMCLVLPSRREGYGLVVIEAAAHGTPSIVVAGADNAAVELISEGENGFVCTVRRLRPIWQTAVLRVSNEGAALRTTTAAWFDANAYRLSLGASLDSVARAYG